MASTFEEMSTPSRMQRMRARMDKLFEDRLRLSSLPYWSRLTQLKKGVRTLPVDIYETSEHVVIKATVAGVRPEEVSICVTGNTVAIKTESKGKAENRGGGAIKQERFCGAFERCLTLPTPVKVDKARATLRNSELVLRLPKVGQKPRFIKVQYAKLPKAS